MSIERRIYNRNTILSYIFLIIKENDGSLAIYPTKMTDLGEYECVVQNRAGDRQSAKAYLNVQCWYLVALKIS